MTTMTMMTPTVTASSDDDADDLFGDDYLGSDDMGDGDSDSQYRSHRKHKYYDCCGAGVAASPPIDCRR